tara:strand:+ start:19 stop:1152 length:1134 start_codon:yes stop_codon:yes gene_type:complete
MKTLLSFLLTFTLSNLVIAQTTAVPDANFEQALINLGYDFGTPDGTVITANIDTVATLNIMNNNISDLTGIEDFTALSDLNCEGNLLTSIDVTQNSALNILQCNSNQLTSLNVTQNIDLTELRCAGNQLTNLDVTQNSDLHFLWCSNNLLTSLDVTQNTIIDTLFCELNQLTSLNVTQNTDLLLLACFTNQLASLDVSQNILLTKLYCEENALTDLDVSQNEELILLYCGANQLVCLNVKNGNNINFLPNALKALWNPGLTCIEVDNPTWSVANWTNVDSPNLFSLNCAPCALGIYENNFSNLICYPNPTKGNISIDIGEVYSKINVIVRNSIGKKVFQNKIGTSDRIEFFLEGESGVYIIEISSENKKAVLRIVKE